MRISDWSSDVCSSDLPIRADILVGEENLGAALAHRLLGLLPDAGDRLTQRVGAIGERIGAVDLRRGSAEMALEQRPFLVGANWGLEHHHALLAGFLVQNVRQIADAGL